MNNDKQIQVSFKDIKEDVMAQAVKILRENLAIELGNTDLDSFSIISENMQKANYEAKSMGYDEWGKMYEFMLIINMLKEKMHQQVTVSAEDLFCETKTIYSRDEPSQNI